MRLTIIICIALAVASCTADQPELIQLVEESHAASD
jgi:hypothetical protein